MLFTRPGHPETVFKVTGQFTDRAGARCVKGTSVDGRYDTAATVEEITLVADVVTTRRVVYN